jgi:folylpolyglutamate synthase/dihydropteroate synthase
VYLDVCHNLSAFEAVIRSLKSQSPDKNIKLRVICGFSKMKDINSILEFMVKNVWKIHFVVWPHFKLASLETLMKYAF